MFKILNQKAHSSKLTTIFIVIAFMIFAVGIVVGQSLLKNTMPVSQINEVAQKCEEKEVKKGSYEDGYNAGLEFAKKRLIEEGILPESRFGGVKTTITTDATDNKKAVTYTPTAYIYGAVVKSVKGSEVEIEFKASQLDIFKEGMLTKTMGLAENVRIEKHIPKDATVYNNEMTEYNAKFTAMMEKVKADGAKKEDLNLPTPLPYTVEYVELSDLKSGDMLNITTTDDVSKNDSFKALSAEFIEPPPAIDLTGKLEKQVK